MAVRVGVLLGVSTFWGGEGVLEGRKEGKISAKRSKSSEWVGVLVGLAILLGRHV